MARAATDEQIELRRRARRRLIGALALVTVIAVVLPWVLEREPRQADQEISIQIPAPDSSAFKSRVGATKAVEPPKAGPTEARPDASAAQPTDTPPPGDALASEQDKVLAAPAPKGVAPKPAVSKDKPVSPAAQPTSTGSSPSTAPAAAEPRKKSETDSKQYVVQVAALADADKAIGIQKELAGKGLKAYTEVVKTASGDVTRVRVGPFPNREAAEKERSRLKAQGFDGNVAPR